MIIHHLPSLCSKWERAAARTLSAAAPSRCDMLAPVDCKRKLNILSFFLRGKVIQVLEKMNSPQEEMNQVLRGAWPPPMGLRAQCFLCTFPPLVAVAPAAARLSLLWPSYCVTSHEVWPGKRRGPGHSEKQVDANSFFGCCGLSSWNDWRVVMREWVHAMCQCLSGWQCWQGGII